MERASPMRKSHTSTADLLTWRENPPSPSTHSASRPNTRTYQPSDGISKALFGGQLTEEEAQSLLKRISDGAGKSNPTKKRRQGEKRVWHEFKLSYLPFRRYLRWREKITVEGQIVLHPQFGVQLFLSAKPSLNTVDALRVKNIPYKEKA